MTIEEAIEQLRDLIRDRKSMIYPDGDNEIYERDIEALQYAVDRLEDDA